MMQIATCDAVDRKAEAPQLEEPAECSTDQPPVPSCRLGASPEVRERGRKLLFARGSASNRSSRFFFSLFYFDEESPRGCCHAGFGTCDLLGRPGSQKDAENQLRRLSLTACDHSAGDLALFSVHLELSRRRRFVGGARNNGLLRNSPVLGEPFRADDRRGFAQATLQALRDLAS